MFHTTCDHPGQTGTGTIALSTLLCLASLSGIWSFSSFPSFSSHAASVLWVSTGPHLEYYPGWAEPGESKSFVTVGRLHEAVLSSMASFPESLPSVSPVPSCGTLLTLAFTTPGCTAFLFLWVPVASLHLLSPLPTGI